MSNRRTPGTWAGKPLRHASDRARQRALPRARVPSPGTPVISGPRQHEITGPARAPLRIVIPPALPAPLRIRRAGPSRSGSGP